MTLDVDVPDLKAQAEIIPAPVEKTPSLALPPNYKPIPVPDAPAISQALLLARALRPLARQISVGLPTILDEVKTVDLIAETRVWLPVLKPRSELWLDVALVFDTSPSMCLWQRLGNDVHRLLSRYGEFRDVRIWRLRHTSGKVDLTDRNDVFCKPKELLVGDLRRLVVIVSDCVAPAWHNGNMRELIEIWSVKLPTVVFHVFPERLWARTALARSVTVEFQGRQPGLPNNNLKPFARSVWDLDRLQASLAQSNVQLPVVSLENDVLSSWAQVVAGDRRSRVLGIVWDAPPVRQSPIQTSSQSTSTFKERIDSFLLTASPLSLDLAGRLASAPVITLPIVRIIKEAMRPPASAVHIAEIFMSGLLKVSGSQVPTFENAERIAYELVDDEVRDRLRAGSLVKDALGVFDDVSKYIAQGLGKSVNEFWALLRTPAMGTSSEETEFLNAFATVTGKILRGLGKEFEMIANSLAPPSIGESYSIEDFPELEVLTFTTARLVEAETESWYPPLQTEEYTVATISIDEETQTASGVELELFSFKVGSIVKSGNDWIVQKSEGQAYRYLEPINENVVLEMVNITGGEFMMGSPVNELKRRDSESYQHLVIVPDFYMGRYPVTQAQWRAVAAMPQVKRKLDLNPSRFNGDTRPVEQVSWEDAIEFCSRLSNHTNRQYRLSTEAEWEYACRAGTTTPFHFGKTISTELANYNGSAYADGPTGVRWGETSPVEHFDVANAWGLSDMHGNVLEWCQDHWHDNYEGAPDDGSAWLTDKTARRVIRGGSCYSYARICRSAYRGSFNPEDRYDRVGFRVSCSKPEFLAALSILCQGYLATNSKSENVTVKEALTKMGWNTEVEALTKMGWNTENQPDISNKKSDTQQASWWLEPFDNATVDQIINEVEREWIDRINGKISNGVMELFESIRQNTLKDPVIVAKAYLEISARLDKVI